MECLQTGDRMVATRNYCVPMTKLLKSTRVVVFAIVTALFWWSTDVWATDFLDVHLDDTGWAFRRQQLDVWAAMNICSGRGFLLASRLQIRFSLCKSVLERLWTLLKCVPKQLNTDNRLHDPRSAAVLGVTLHFCRPNVSTSVVQMSNSCRPNVQPVSFKWSSHKNLSPKRLSPKRLVGQTSLPHFDVSLSSSVIYKFSTEDNRPLYNVSHAQQWNLVTCKHSNFLLFSLTSICGLCLRPAPMNMLTILLGSWCVCMLHRESNCSLTPPRGKWIAAKCAAVSLAHENQLPFPRLWIASGHEYE